VSQKPLSTLAYCDDCHSSHLGAPCGMSFVERLRTTQIHGSATPSKDKKDYWDDNGLKEIFGLDRNERRAQMADATGGRGYTTISDLDGE
jgi:hypothetical protein